MTETTEEFSVKKGVTLEDIMGAIFAFMSIYLMCADAIVNAIDALGVCNSSQIIKARDDLAKAIDRYNDLVDLVRE